MDNIYRRKCKMAYVRRRNNDRQFGLNGAILNVGQDSRELDSVEI